jgi:hypothetical protein
MILSEAKSSNYFNKSHPLFGLSKKLPKIETVKGFLGFINVLLADYGFCIKNVRINTSTKINGIKKNIHNISYIIHFINNINLFV